MFKDANDHCETDLQEEIKNVFGFDPALSGFKILLGSTAVLMDIGLFLRVYFGPTESSVMTSFKCHWMLTASCYYADT